MFNSIVFLMTKTVVGAKSLDNLGRLSQKFNHMLSGKLGLFAPVVTRCKISLPGLPVTKTELLSGPEHVSSKACCPHRDSFFKQMICPGFTNNGRARCYLFTWYWN